MKLELHYCTPGSLFDKVLLMCCHNFVLRIFIFPQHRQTKDVVKSLKKRIIHKNPKVQLLALTLLETMIKNCGDIVHMHVAERDILHEMVKIVKKRVCVYSLNLNTLIAKKKTP